MKRILLLLLLFVTVAAEAQVYNNEWIDYSKTYYKFKIGATGLYRISQPVLSGIGLGSASAEHFQLWRNGKQVPIYTSIQTGVMGGGDYIEFWGEMNDGNPDSVMYRLPDYQLCQKWSLQTDTAAYFLTINTSGANFRLAPTTNNVAGNILPVEPYFMYTAGTYYKNKIHSGRSELVGDSYTYSSSYDYGEGWSSQDLPALFFTTSTHNNLSAYTGSGAPQPVIKVNAAGNAVQPRYFKVTVNGDSVAGQALNYYDYAKVTAPVPLTLISGGTATIQVTNMGLQGGDRMVVAMTELIYARQFNFGGASNFTFELPANTSGNYLEISGFTYSGSAPVLYDLTNGKRYVADITNPSLLKIALEASVSNRKLVLVSEATSNITAVTSFQQRNFVNYSQAANQGNYLIITNPVLTTASNGSNPIDDYKSYRSSVQGGSYNAKVYMIDQLEDQFGLGIKKHPLSIRNFLRWARANFSAPLKTVLIIGKGLNYTQFRAYESNPDVEKLDLVTSFGYPASDNLLSAVPGSSVPLTPIGRISAINGDEVNVYLNKLKEYEQLHSFSSPVIQDKAWMKNILHVIGAGDPLTENILVTALNGHKRIIEDTLYGGYVSTFSKGSADAVQQIDNSRLADIFNNGVGILTYFGHSSASTLEFNLDNPLNYSNAGKYPVFVVMGCNAGNFFNFNVARFSTKETLSEKYVLAPERGSIAFLASTHLGIVHYLDIQNTQNYTTLSTTNYGKTLGEIMDATIARVFGITTENDFYARFHCEQFTLHGDPALKLYNFAKPDYAIEDPMVKISPSFITVGDQNFTMKARFMNIGKAVSDSVVIEVKRTYPTTQVTEVIYKKRIRGIRYIDSLTLDIPIVPTRDKGLNKITITIDPDNEIDELYETSINNIVTKDVFIFEDEARPVYPYNLSIVNDQNIKLVASSANPFATMRDYIAEIDTTELFNSPVKVTRTTSSVGGVFEFTPGITFSDSTVYYWRVAPNVTTGYPVWNTSSFIYISGTNTGFNQSHYFQHDKSSLQRTILRPDRKWVFDSVGHNIFIKNGVYQTATTQEGDLIVSLDGDPFIRSACVGFSLIFNLINPNTFQPVENLTGYMGSALPCFSNRRFNFEWSYMTAAKRKQMMDFMDSIPVGYYVVVRTINNHTQTTGFINEWMADTLLYGSGNSLYHKLKNVGFNALDSFSGPNSRALICLYKKGDNSFAPMSVGSFGLYDLITINRDIRTPDTLGYITSPIMGPAKAWQELKWRGSMDLTPGDSVSVDVIGVKADGSESVLFSGLSLSQQDYDVSSIDASVYPNIKLRMFTSDTSHFTPYQLRYWRVYYTPVPEGAIAPNLYFTTKESVDVGEPFNFGIGFKNISRVDFDSVKVKMVITDEKNRQNIVPIPRQKPLTTTAPNDTIRLNVPIDTRSIPGNNVIYVEFNSDNDQLEQYHFNNFAFRNLYVKPDSLNPLLDVTFDGVHILNRDIVSSKPDIIIKLKDEAKWMILDTASLMTLKVKYPDGSMRTFTPGNDTLQFTPAGQAPNTNNTAMLNFKPYFPQDGEYELIVTGKDRSDNKAGNIEYRVFFQVINKPMISNMLNYPNPFTTSTAFVFTVTGSEVPQNIRIQILTITGKIVRDITKDELGPLHIGRNITEFKWDGTDQYGQKLANGIYLYRVITNMNGKSLDKYKAEDDDTDKYFNKGYGKMYLMR
ncbi:MAG: hypothetical protein JNN00_13610 [Chitinophagaceae bacterium]|nr:hypothetical protein [Chitinophagaceae bacterium]